LNCGDEEWGVGSGEWGVGSGEWRVESGEWRVESGEWGVGSGEWRVRSLVSTNEKNHTFFDPFHSFGSAMAFYCF
jgi:hypothetical protein